MIRTKYRVCPSTFLRIGKQYFPSCKKPSNTSVIKRLSEVKTEIEKSAHSSTSKYKSESITSVAVKEFKSTLCLNVLLIVNTLVLKKTNGDIISSDISQYSKS